jgi:predicted acyltransferase
MATVSVEHPAKTTLTRMVSLDVLRGLTIAFMILVNHGGHQAYWPLQHSDWNGWTPTDLVFPTFLFLVGVTIVLSLESRLSRGDTPNSVVPRILRRFILLFCLGLFVNGFPKFPWAHLRIYGVLQRIAICYLIGSLIYLWTRHAKHRVTVLLVLLGVSLVGYWALMRWVPVPGYGLPGRDIPFMDKDANLVAWLDRHIFPGRLYEGTRDPEGLISNLPAVGTTLLGILTALWLRTNRTIGRKCAGLLGGGVVCILLAELWNPWFPINKKLWTSSFVLFTAGCALVLWALMMWLTEIKGWKKGWTGFWLVFGTNAIAAYVFSEIVSPLMAMIPMGSHLNLNIWIQRHLLAAVHPVANASLCYAIFIVLLCWLPMAVLYRKRIFLKV